MVLGIINLMQDLWARLAAPFPDEETIWLITEISSGDSRARVRSQVSFDAITTRLNFEVGVSGWSNTYVAPGDGVLGCALTIGQTTKSAIVEALEGEMTEQMGQISFVRAAELFGMKPTQGTEYVWVDYDVATSPSVIDPWISTITPENPGGNGLSQTLDISGASIDNQKTKGQRAIDRLVDRLRDSGCSEEAAGLLVEYGGYGNNREAARELYSKLRALLLNKIDIQNID